MRINTNVSSLEAQRAISEHIRQVENSSGKLSSGTRVRSAADDSASLAIGTKHRAEIRSQYQALRNANDVVSELQVAEGGMNEVSSMLTRLKELSLQASSDFLQDSDRGMLNQEYMALRHEIERQLKTTNYRGENLLQPENIKTREYVIGTKADKNSMLVIDQNELLLSEFNLGIVDSHISSAEDARLNLNYIDNAIGKVSENRARVGAIQNRVESTINNLDTSQLNESTALSQRMDADYAFETSEKIRGEHKLHVANSVFAQTKNLGSSAITLINKLSSS